MLHLFTKNYLLACLFLLLSGQLAATTYTFNGTTNNDWATTSNWSTGVVPTTALLTSGDAVVIDANCTMNSIVITFPSGTSLTVNSAKSLSLNTTSGITVNSGATLTVQSSGSILQGYIDNYGTMNISGSYTAFYMTNRASATLNVLSGGSYSCPACAESFQAGGTINNSGTMHVGTGSTWQGTINNNAGGTITDGGNGAQIQLGANGTLNNYGSFVSRTAGMSGIFNNYSTGTLTMPPTCYFTVKNGSTFTNDGTVTLPYSNTLFDIKAGGTMANQNTFSGIGGLAQSGTFTNSAAADINPGNSPGKLTVTGPLDLGSATYNCEINGTTQGTNYDWLAISGEATLTNASLVVNWSSYTPTAGLTFTVLTCGSRTGTFASVTIPPVSGIVFSTTYTSTSFYITTSAAPTTYTFTGSGNWSSTGNWDANGIPPNPLPTGDAIVIDGSGTCTMDANKTINSGASLTVNAGKTLTISGGFTLTNNGAMTINGTFSKSSGTLTNSATGDITVASGGALNNDSGSFSNAGSLTTNSGGTFGNQSGGFTNSGTYANGGSNYSTYGSFSNSGTITNTGTMTSGQYIFIGNSGSWTNSSGGTMTMDGFNNSGASASLTNNGMMNIGLNNSKTFVNNATFTANYFGQSNNSGATWTNSSGATFTVGATPFTNVGTFNNDGTMTLNQNGNTGSTFANNGTFNCAGTLILNSGSGSNAANKTISVSGSGTLNINNNFTFTNNGTLNNSATVVLNGTFNGTGTLVQNGTFTNNSTGIIAPGASPGTLTVTGNLDLGSSTYQAEVAGTTQGSTYDLLSISGTATIGGSSKLHVIFSVPVVNGTTFDVLTAGTVSGTFGTVTFANTGTGNVTAISVSYPGGNSVRVTATSLLPVELVRFTGKFIPPSGEKEGGVLLEWETASELNNEGFHVERSTDGRRWSEVGFVAGNGTTTETQAYSLMDEKPLPGLNYYRLRQTDFDGGEELSKVASVSILDGQSTIRAYPNPISSGNAITLMLGKDLGGSFVEIRLFDGSGKLVKISSAPVDEKIELELDGVTPGVYWLEVRTSEKRFYERLVVR